MDGRDRIASADDGRGSGGGGRRNRLGHFQRSLRKGRQLENPHGSVPHDRFRLGDFRDIRGDRFGTDVEAHLVWRCGGYVADGGLGGGLQLGRNKVVGRQQKLEVFLLGFGEQTLGQLDFVIFHERFADGQPLRFFKSVR